MELEFNIKLLWSVIRKFWVIILASALLVGVAGVAATTFISERYSSTAKFYTINIQSEASYTQAALVSAAQELAKDYIEIIRSDVMLDPVRDQLEEEAGYSFTSAQLLSMLSCSVISDTAAFSVTVTTTDRVAAQVIVNTIERNMSSVISKTVKRENCVELITSGKAAEKVSPSVPTFAVLGALLGGIASFIVLIVRTMLDCTVKTEEDIKGKFKVPVIGIIPEWESDGKAKQGKGVS